VTNVERPSTAAVSPSTETLGVERELLARAQRAITRGDPERALTFTARHAARFPQGVLLPERLALQAIALCETGDPEAGANVIARLSKAVPGAPSIARAQEACTP